MKNKKHAKDPIVVAFEAVSVGESVHSIHHAVSPKMHQDGFYDLDDFIKEKHQQLLTKNEEINQLYNKQSQDSSYKLDWLTFTMDIKIEEEIITDFHKGNGNDIYIVFNFLKDKFGIEYDDFERCSPVNFFNTGLTVGGFLKVFWNDLYNNVQSSTTKYIAQITFTGMGCTWLYELCPDNYKILNEINLVAKNITRVDVAFDSFKDSDMLSLDRIIEKLEKFEYRSPKRTHNIVKESDSVGNMYSKGAYIGNRNTQDSYYLRCYDKLIQSRKKGERAPDIAINNNRWERFELSFSSKLSAMNFVEDFLFNSEYQNNIDKLFKSVMSKCVTFIDPEYYKNGKLKNKNHKERWKVSQFWIDYLENTKEYEFSSVSREPNFVSSLSWLSESVMPTLKVLDEILSSYNIDIYDEIKNYNAHKKELSKKQYRMKLEAKKLGIDTIKDIMLDFKSGKLVKSVQTTKKIIKGGLKNGKDIQEK